MFIWSVLLAAAEVGMDAAEVFEQGDWLERGSAGALAAAGRDG